MIGKLFGIIYYIYSDHRIINVNGVVHIVYCSKNLINNHCLVDKVTLRMQKIIKEKDISIFGFLNSIYKEFFNHLLIYTRRWRETFPNHY